MNTLFSVSEHTLSLVALARRSTLTATMMLVSACIPEVDPDIFDDVEPALDQLEALQPRQASSPGIAAMGLGDGTSCAVTTTGNVKCWGRNEYGQLGLADTTSIGDNEKLETTSYIDVGPTGPGNLH